MATTNGLVLQRKGNNIVSLACHDNISHGLMVVFVSGLAHTEKDSNRNLVWTGVAVLYGEIDYLSTSEYGV